MTMEAAAVKTLLELARFAGQVVVSGVWQGVALLAVAALCLRLLYRVSAKIRFAVWCVVFALLVVTPLLAALGVGMGSGSLQGGAPVTSATVHLSTLHLGTGWAVGIAVLWVVLSTFRAVQLVHQVLRVRGIWKRARPIAVWPEVAALPGVLPSRGAEICISIDVDSPAVIGFFSPRLLLPESLLTSLSPAELRPILLHEGEHLRRYDDWVNLLQKMVLVLFPLNPALFWIDRRLGLERELACDAGVVAATADRLQYAACLTRLADRRLRSRRVALALSAWGRQSELGRRVYRLLQPVRTLPQTCATAASLALSFGLACGSLAIARVPHLVAFNELVESATNAAATAPSPQRTQVVPVSYHPAAQWTDGPQASGTQAAGTRASGTLIPPRAKARVTLVRAEMPGSGAVAVPGSEPIPSFGPERQTRRPRASPGPVYAFSISTTSYAAVPFGDGWLLIEL